MILQKRVLIIEDEKNFADMIERKWTEAGFQTHVFNTVPSARVYLETHPTPDLVWTDHYLSDHTGLELVTFIRTEQKNTTLPIVIVSNTTASTTYAPFLNENTLFFLKANYSIGDIIEKTCASFHLNV